jgi:hypothetical protein
MLDIIILSNPTTNNTLSRTLDSIMSQVDAPPHQIHIVNATLKELNRPGHTINQALTDCNNQMFTILDPRDTYLPDMLRNLYYFVQNKRFGLIYASALNANSGQLNPVQNLPLIPDTMYKINPVQSPIFYNRKVVDYLRKFNVDTSFPEYDMSLKIWERFPIFHLNIPLLTTLQRRRPSVEFSQDLDNLIAESKLRYSRYYFNAGPNLFPDNLLEPLCLPPLSSP